MPFRRGLYCSVPLLSTPGRYKPLVWSGYFGSERDAKNECRPLIRVDRRLPLAWQSESPGKQKKKKKKKKKEKKKKNKKKKTVLFFYLYLTVWLTGSA